MQSARSEPVIVLESDDDEQLCTQQQAGPSGRQASHRQPKRARIAPAARHSSTLPRPGRTPPAQGASRTRRAGGSSTHSGGREDRQGDTRTAVVDLTSSSPDEHEVVMVPASLQPARRRAQRVSLVLPKEATLPEDPAKDPQCAICLEPMTAMSCGPCGHVFCDNCLRAAVKAQKKCPTCRKTMACRQIHRVYLNVS